MSLSLSPTEQAYLANKEQFSKTKQRYVRYRIRKKLLRRDAAAAFCRDGGLELPSSERKAETLPQQIFFERSRTTFSRLCKASAFLLQEGALE
jgi:hypothetical protein